MRFDAITVAALAALTEALDEPGADIATTLSRLGDVVAAAVPSFLALSLRTGSGDAQIEITGRSDAAPPDLRGIRTSLAIPLPGRDGGPTESLSIESLSTESSSGQSGNALILYAEKPGALVDIAADIAWLTGLPLDSFRLDQHAGPPVDDGSAQAWQDASTVNQAVGVLLERGYTFDNAWHHLEQLAATAGVGAAVAAALMLARLSERDEAP